ncbi:MAG: hypothetical protein J6D18_03305, partial [Erysipelotrichaceae bacterium]|nr:hypothetical protein [Erysipelotrichaceae bacterium]
VLIVLYQVYESGRYHRYFLIPVLCIPLIGFVCVDTLYLNANENLYGVRYIQTRTDGQFGQFVNRVYKIESSHRNGDIWAPYDAIQKAFSASPTLKSNPKLLKKISKSQWVQGDIKKNPIQGDFLTWTLRDALVDAGLWKNQKKTEQFFEKVNRELDDAFQSGELKKDKRFQIISSAGGRNRQERWQLIPLMSKMYRGHIFLNGYRSGGANSEIHSKKLVNKLSTFLHTPYLKDNKINGKKMNYDVANTVTEILFVFYMILNPFLFIVSVFSIGLTLMDCIRNRNRLRWSLRKNPNRYYAWIGSLMVLSIAIVYSFSISWFVSFVYNQGNAIQGQYWLNFYGIGLASLLGVFYMFGIRSFDVYVSRIKRTIRKPVKKRA